MARIVVCGFAQESNSFVGRPTLWADFAGTGTRPPPLRGDALGAWLDANPAINKCIVGFANEARRLGHDLAPAMDCSAEPSGPLTLGTFERISAAILDEIARRADEGPIDAVYCDLHGAMMVEGHDDGEGEFLRRVRALVGDAVPIAASLDLHANVTAEMVRHTDALDAYRTYPHVDQAETGARCAVALDRILAGAASHGKAFRAIDLLTRAVAQTTFTEPVRGLYARVAELARRPGISTIALTLGCWTCDEPNEGHAVFAHGDDAAAVEAAVAELEAAVLAAEPAMVNTILPPERAVAEAIRLAATASKPISIADLMDNPGGGWAGDGVWVLHELIRQDAPEAAMGVLWDPALAAEAHRLGAGAEAELSIGGFSGDVPSVPPVRARVRVEQLSDGTGVGRGPVARNREISLGPTARLRVLSGQQGVQVVVSSERAQTLDREMLRCVGLHPEAMKILVIKSAVHFRADFTPISEAMLDAGRPGVTTLVVPEEMPHRRLRPGLRLGPCGPTVADVQARRARAA